jgi:O-acetyl-ADP-ribose deacetylase (regulator of RNase III)
MINYIEHGDIFDSKADALVNPVNCKGVMGKGIAREFRMRFPECMGPYREACKNGKLVPGRLMQCGLNVQLDFWEYKRPRVILFPTKYHWRGKSRLEWIDQGLAYLKDHYHQWGLNSIAMPQLGCGLGGLYWQDVQPLIEKYFSNEPLEVHVYIDATRRYNEKPTELDGVDESARRL